MVLILAILSFARQLHTFGWEKMKQESFGGLDLKHMKKVAELLKLVKMEGRTIPVITYDVEFIKEMADNMVDLTKLSCPAS